MSTGDDYLVFTRMLLDQGRSASQQVLSPAAVRLMTGESLSQAQKSRSDSIPLEFTTHTWGMGLSIVTDPDQIWPRGSYGWTGGLGTYWVTDPLDDLVAVAMTQVAMTSPESTQVFDDFAEAVLASG